MVHSPSLNHNSGANHCLPNYTPLLMKLTTAPNHPLPQLIEPELVPAPTRPIRISLLGFFLKMRPRDFIDCEVARCIAELRDGVDNHGAMVIMWVSPQEKNETDVQRSQGKTPGSQRERRSPHLMF